VHMEVSRAKLYLDASLKNNKCRKYLKAHEMHASRDRFSDTAVKPARHQQAAEHVGTVGSVAFQGCRVPFDPKGGRRREVFSGLPLRQWGQQEASQLFPRARVRESREKAVHFWVEVGRAVAGLEGPQQEH